jgi:hypothetical protein
MHERSFLGDGSRVCWCAVEDLLEGQHIAIKGHLSGFTLYSWRRCSSNSNMLATLPHLFPLCQLSLKDQQIKDL